MQNTPWYSCIRHQSPVEYRAGTVPLELCTDNRVRVLEMHCDASVGPGVLLCPWQGRMDFVLHGNSPASVWEVVETSL